MSRLIHRPARVSQVSDGRFGARPHRIRWQDRFGNQHDVVVSHVQDQWMDALDWDQTTLALRERRYWRLLLATGGVVVVYEDLSRPAGDPQRWMVDRVED